MKKNEKIYIAGHEGLLGSALMRTLKTAGYTNFVFATKAELDLRNQQMVENFFAAKKPDYVFLAAATVGGIKANNELPAQFLYDNLMIQTNVIHAAHNNKVKKILFIGSSCIYPRTCPQPMQPHHLLTGELEKTNEAYAIAKIAGIKMVQSYRKQYGDNFISCMPTNLYGPGDTFDAEKSHVIPALMLKIHHAHFENAKTVHLWGTGNALREFLYVDDCARALLFLMENFNGFDPINIGSGEEISICDLAQMIKKVVGYRGTIVFDQQLEGTPRKLLDCAPINNLGWNAHTSIDVGLKRTYEWYIGRLKNCGTKRIDDLRVI